MFGIDMQVQKAVGTEAYGLYFSLLNLSIIFNIILDAGLTNFNNRNIAQYSHMLSKYFSNLVVLKFLLSLVYALVIFVVAYFVNYDERHQEMLWLLAFNQFLLSFILYLRSNISGLHKFRTDSFISVLDRLLMIIICSYLLYCRTSDTKFRIEWFVYAQTVAYFITSLAAFFITYKQLRFFRLKFDLRFLLVIIKQSYPFALLVLLMSIYNRIDGVMLERMMPDSTQAGIYAHAFRVLDAVSMFALLFATLLLPIFSKMIKQKENVGQMTKLSFLLLIVPVFALSIGSFIFGEEIISMLYNSHIELSTKIFKILILGFIPIASTYIFGTLLTAGGRLKYLNIMAGFGMLGNVILNFVLIPHYEAYGAAIASLLTQFLTALAQIIISLVYFKMKLNIKLLGKLILYILVLFTSFYFATKLPFHWIINFSLAFFSNLIFALFVKLIDLRALYKIVRYDKE